MTVDVYMENMSGLELTRHIMETGPIPIVVVSRSYTPADSCAAEKLLEAGAVAAVAKPCSADLDYADLADKLLQTIRTMSEIKVLRRLKRHKISKTSVLPLVDYRQKPMAVFIGASTGGPSVLKTILSGLSPQLPVPILVVQHITMGFLPGLVDWLNLVSALSVKIAEDGEKLLAGKVYIAPDGYQMGVNGQHQVVLKHESVQSSVCPSVSYLFRSAAETYGSQCIAILLTGMGCDGAKELKLLCDANALTVAQDEPSSAIFGMPGEAIKLNAAKAILQPAQIARLINETLRTPAYKGAVAD